MKGFEYFAVIDGSTFGLIEPSPGGTGDKMPIKIPNNLPAYDTLTSENIFVMTETRAVSQDIRPLKLLLLNLMPTKIDTETQLMRLLGNTPASG